MSEHETHNTLCALGQLDLSGPASTHLRGRKTLALLVYLARHAPRAVPRERLCRLFWGDRDETRARQSLRQALLELRRALGASIDVDGERVMLRTRAVTLDVTEFERDVSELRHAAAVERWHGDFLEPVYADAAEALRQWIDGERERLQRRFGVALAHLVAQAVRHGDWAAAESRAERWARALPLDDRAHLQWIHALRGLGRGAEALAVYTSFVARWRTTLGEELPSTFLRLGSQLSGERAAEPATRERGTVAVHSPECIGREMLLAELGAAWQDAAKGASSVVLVESARGMGRSRLCREFLRELRTGRMRHVVLQANRIDARHTPLGTAQDLFHDLRGARGLGGASPEALAELVPVAPWLPSDFVALPSPRLTSRALVQACRETLEAVAEETPVVIVVDDVTMADADSQRLLLSLAGDLPSRVLVVLTTRREDADYRTFARGLLDAPAVRRIALYPLALGELDAMLASMLTMHEGERRQLALRLERETRGVPQAIVDAVAAMVEAEELAPDAPRSTLTLRPVSCGAAERRVG